MAATISAAPVSASTSGSDADSDVGSSTPGSETDSVHEIEEALQGALEQVPDLKHLLRETAAQESDLVIEPPTDTGVLLKMESSTGSTLDIPMHGDNAIRMSASDGMELFIELPGAAGEAKRTSGGLAVFESVHKDTDLILQAQKDAGVRVIAMLHSLDAPRQLGFGFKVATTSTAKINHDGSVVIVDNDGHVISIIPTSWAYDSVGNEVHSWYSVQGSNLVPNIDHRPGIVYPVIADPQFTWGNISGTAYFSRLETQDVAGAAAVVIGMLVPSLPPPFNAIVAWYTFPIGVWAASAEDHECLKVKYGFTWSLSGDFAPGLTPGHYVEEAGFECE